MPQPAHRQVMVMMHHNVGGEVEQLDHPIATILFAVVVAIGLRHCLCCCHLLSEQEM
jgi:hypothetical protein